jgi:beta-N-acetylglucosaminidase
MGKRKKNTKRKLLLLAFDVGMILLVVTLIVAVVKDIFNIKTNSVTLSDSYYGDNTYISSNGDNVTITLRATTDENNEVVYVVKDDSEQEETVDLQDDGYSENPDENVVRVQANSEPYSGEITVNTDLLNRMEISESDIQKCIDVFTSEYPDSLFKTCASAFIEAARNTGYDPIFLLSLAGLESGWNVADLHRERNNPYSIAMYDYDIYQGATLGSTFAEGIINGATIIYESYYITGQTTLYGMQDGDHYYASSDTWSNTIAVIMNECYQIISND